MGRSTDGCLSPVQEEEIGYHLQWEIVSTAGTSGSLLNQPRFSLKQTASQHLQITAQSAKLERSNWKATGHAEIVAVFLQFLQQNPAVQLNSSVSICTVSPCRSQHQSSAIASGLEALARVANSEGAHQTATFRLSSPVVFKTSSTGAWPATRADAGLCHAPRLMPYSGDLSGSRGSTGTRSLRTLQSVAITGGTGALGLLTAHWMTQQGANHVSLLSRTGRGSIPATLFDSPSVIQITHCDVASREEAGELSAALTQHARLSHVLHAGGVVKDALLTNQNLSSIRQVMSPKNEGLLSLLDILRTQGSHYTVFSSIAGVLGSSGQGNYAAANSIMDELTDIAAGQVGALDYSLYPSFQNIVYGLAWSARACSDIWNVIIRQTSSHLTHTVAAFLGKPASLQQKFCISDC